MLLGIYTDGEVDRIAAYMTTNLQCNILAAAINGFSKLAAEHHGPGGDSDVARCASQSALLARLALMRRQAIEKALGEAEETFTG